MKKYLLVIILQVFALSMWADNNNDDDYLLFQVENHDTGTGMEYQVPVTGSIKNNMLYITYKGSAQAYVSVKNKNGSSYFQNFITSGATISVNMFLFPEGEYVIRIEDPKGNVALSYFYFSK